MKKEAGYLDKGYMVPENAIKKLRLARGLKKTVYIYGATGFGKTELVKQYLSKRRYRYFSCKDVEKTEEDKEREKEPGSVVVVDDLQLLQNSRGGGTRENSRDNCKTGNLADFN